MKKEMATKTLWCLEAICVFTSCLNVYLVVSEYLDLEELKNINYGIHIVNEPVKLSTEDPASLENTVYMKSKFGQQYQCSFPNQGEQDRQKEEAEKSALEIGIPDLLKPLEEGPCLFKAKDWWSYEFCYGKYVRQFHAEDGHIKGDIVYLGHFESEFDWKNETNQESTNNRLNRYHSQRYVNGTKCDLTGKPRQIEVRFLCEEGSGDYIARIDEPGTCSYIMNIHTTKICHHPYLKPPTKSKPIQITCSPLLTDTQYEEYSQQVEEEKRLKEIEEKALEEKKRLKLEELEKQKAELELKAKENSEDDTETEVTVEDEDEVMPGQSKITSVQDLISEGDTDVNDMEKFNTEINEALQKELHKLMQNMPGEKSTGSQSNMKVKVISSLDDLKDVLKNAMQEADSIKKVKPVSEQNSLDDQEKTQLTDDDKSVEEETQEVKGERSKATPEESKVTGDKQETKKQLKDEEEEESDKSFGVDWRKFSMKRLTEAITDLEGKSKLLLELFMKYREPDPDLIFDVKKLRQKYVETVAEVREIKSEFLDKLLTMNVEKIEDLKDFRLTADVYQQKYDAVIEKLESVTSETEEMVDLLKGLIKQEIKVQGDSIEGEDENKAQGDSIEGEDEESDTDVQGPQKTDTSLKDKVKVTLTKIGNKDINEIKNSKNSIQVEQLEKEVQESLEEAGLNLGEGKIQVKIITAGYYDDKEEKLHMLSDEDTKSFKNMIVSILGGDNEAAKEQERHSQLEENYNFVWGKDNKKSKDL